MRAVATIGKAYLRALGLGKQTRIPSHTVLRVAPNLALLVLGEVLIPSAAASASDALRMHRSVVVLVASPSEDRTALAAD